MVFLPSFIWCIFLCCLLLQLGHTTTDQSVTVDFDDKVAECIPFGTFAVYTRHSLKKTNAVNAFSVLMSAQSEIRQPPEKTKEDRRSQLYNLIIRDLKAAGCGWTIGRMKSAEGFVELLTSILWLVSMQTIPCALYFIQGHMIAGCDHHTTCFTVTLYNHYYLYCLSFDRVCCKFFAFISHPMLTLFYSSSTDNGNVITPHRFTYQ